MACPKCNCKVTYTHDDSWDGYPFDEDYEREKCSACGYVFYVMDADDTSP